VDPKKLPKPVKVAFCTWDKWTEGMKKLLDRMGRLNQGLDVDLLKIIERKMEQDGQRLILLIDKDSVNPSTT
jgi:hypothetical protein